MNVSASRYTADISLQDINDAHVLALGRVPANCNVLDLGVADGSVAAVLKEMGCRIWGVDIDPIAADEARLVCEDVIVGNLQDLDLAECLGSRRYDVILMLDILEHLSDPVSVLTRLEPMLAKGGWAILSLPNVAHISLRLALFEGRFTYTDVGLLDRTHLRFFDRDGVNEFLTSAGWGMFDLARVTRSFGTTEVTIDDADPEIVARLESDPEADTYQFVVSVAPLGSPMLNSPPLLPAAVAQGLVLEQRREMAALREEIRQLQSRCIPDLMEQLAAIRAGGEIRRDHLKYLMAAMRENRERLIGPPME